MNRKLNVLLGMINALDEATDDKIELFIQERPYLLKKAEEELKVIPNLKHRQWEAQLKVQTICAEILHLIEGKELEKIYETNPALTEEEQERYKILKARVEKGYAYLKKEYWTAWGGKGRRDPQMQGYVDEWFKLHAEQILLEGKMERASA